MAFACDTLSTLNTYARCWDADGNQALIFGCTFQLDFAPMVGMQFHSHSARDTPFKSR